jgi:hypothetical protein
LEFESTLGLKIGIERNYKRTNQKQPWFGPNPRPRPSLASSRQPTLALHPYSPARGLLWRVGPTGQPFSSCLLSPCQCRVGPVRQPLARATSEPFATATRAPYVSRSPVDLPHARGLRRRSPVTAPPNFSSSVHASTHLPGSHKARHRTLTDPSSFCRAPIPCHQRRRNQVGRHRRQYSALSPSRFGSRAVKLQRNLRRAPVGAIGRSGHQGSSELLAGLQRHRGST